MNANDSLERGIADVYERDAPRRAPDWVLRSVLDAIDQTPQRRGLIPAPWRFRHMNTYSKAAIAAVVVIALGALGLNLFGPRDGSSVGGAPSPSPSSSPSAVPTAPPPLSKTYTSRVHGITISYPAGWATSAATQNWTGGPFTFPNPDMDYMYDGLLTSDLFIVTASQPLAGKVGERWVADYMSNPESDCAQGGSAPITVDGANGSICGNLVAVSTANRGYFIRLYTSADRPTLHLQYDSAWFRGLLATVRLHPEDAVDTASSPSA